MLPMPPQSRVVGKELPARRRAQTEIKRRLRNDVQAALDYVAITRPTAGKVSISAVKMYGKVSNSARSNYGKVSKQPSYNCGKVYPSAKTARNKGYAYATEKSESTI